MLKYKKESNWKFDFLKHWCGAFKTLL